MFSFTHFVYEPKTDFFAIQNLEVFYRNRGLYFWLIFNVLWVIYLTREAPRSVQYTFINSEIVIYSISINRETQKCVVIEVGFFLFLLCQMWRPVTSPVYVDVRFWQPVPTHINLLRSRFSYYWLGITHTVRSQLLLLSSIGLGYLIGVCWCVLTYWHIELGGMTGGGGDSPMTKIKLVKSSITSKSMPQAYRHFQLGIYRYARQLWTSGNNWS